MFASKTLIATVKIIWTIEKQFHFPFNMEMFFCLHLVVIRGQSNNTRHLYGLYLTHPLLNVSFGDIDTDPPHVTWHFLFSKQQAFCRL